MSISSQRKYRHSKPRLGLLEPGRAALSLMQSVHLFIALLEYAAKQQQQHAIDVHNIDVLL